MLQVLFTAAGRAGQPAGLRLRDGADGICAQSASASELLKVTIHTALDKWLGSVIRVDDVATRANDARLEVRITYLLRSRQERRILNLEVTP